MTALRSILLENLSAVRTDGPYALVDYPNYLNPGDAAIWLGARAALAAVNVRLPAYISTLRNFSPERCRAAVGNGTVYLLGGGNFGDLYTRHHLSRLRLIESMPGNPIVQLPASCAWTSAPDAALLEKTRRVIGRHPNFRFLAREGKTARQLHCFLGIETVLCPDLAHALEPSGPSPSIRIRKILRRDSETASLSSAWQQDAVDWRDMSAQRFWNRFGKLLLASCPGATSIDVMDLIARRKTEAATALIAQGRVLVTDRLHALLLGSAIGRSVVILDNTTGKLAAYHHSWQEHFPRAIRAADLTSAIREAERLTCSCPAGRSSLHA